MIGLLVGVKLYGVRGSLDCDTAEKVGGVRQGPLIFAVIFIGTKLCSEQN